MVCSVELSYPRFFLTLGGSISVLSILVIFILYYYYRIPNLRRHPTTITIHKCWFELLFVSQYLWLSFAPNSFYWNHWAKHASDCDVNPRIWPLCWLTQFSLLGGELWFAAISLDIHVSLTNPFSSHKSNMAKYRLMVYGIAFLTATALVSIRPLQYGLSVDPMVWITVKSDTADVNWMKLGIFYVFMGAIYVYCAYIGWWARSQIHKGLETTLLARKYTVSKQTRCKFNHLSSNIHYVYLLEIVLLDPACPTITSGTAVTANITTIIVTAAVIASVTTPSPPADLIVYCVSDVLGYLAFWTLVFVLQFVNYVDTSSGETVLTRVRIMPCPGTATFFHASVVLIPMIPAFHLTNPYLIERHTAILSPFMIIIIHQTRYFCQFAD